LARSEFGAVVRDYAITPRELRDDAAEAHAGLGLIALETTRDQRTAIARARREYLAAANITTIGRRKRFFLRRAAALAPTDVPGTR